MTDRDWGRSLIGGTARSATQVIGTVENPSTGEALGPMCAATSADVDDALTHAFAAWGSGHGSLSGYGPDERVAMLKRLADTVDERGDELARWHAVETGVPIATARVFASGLGDVLRAIAAIAPQVTAPSDRSTGGRRVVLLRLPWGPAALFAPWNAGAFLAVTKLGYALATGCPGILKPSEYTLGTTAVLVDALVHAELPPGAAQVVCGGADVGARLASDPRVRMISYTGGTAGGRAVAAAAAERMVAVQLELSASNPALVTRSADVEHAARELARAALLLNGQWCEAPRRVLVDRAVHGALVDALVEELACYRIGGALDEDTQLGPLAHRRHLETVVAAVEALAAQGRLLVRQGPLPQEGCFFAPTVVASLPLGAVRQEIFGPVLAVSPYDSVGDALAAANALGDGLAAYVFAGDREEAFALGSRLHAGEVRLGGARLLDLVPGSAQSFWGTSGVGGHGLVPVLEAHLGTRIVGEDDLALAI